jgi:hypothetical protein
MREICPCPECNLNIKMYPKEEPTRILRGECECGIILEIIYPEVIVTGGLE